MPAKHRKRTSLWIRIQDGVLRKLGLVRQKHVNGLLREINRLRTERNGK